LENRIGEGASRGHGRTENDEEDGQGKQRFRLVLEVGDTVANCRIDDGLAAVRIRNRLLVALKKQLIDAVVLIEEAQRGFLSKFGYEPPAATKKAATEPTEEEKAAVADERYLYAVTNTSVAPRSMRNCSIHSTASKSR
jgi:hypothetical protein